MSLDLLQQIRDNDARSDGQYLPSRQEFREISDMFRMASFGEGAHLSAQQCQMMMRTFATLAVSTVTIDPPQ